MTFQGRTVEEQPPTARVSIGVLEERRTKFFQFVHFSSSAQVPTSTISNHAPSSHMAPSSVSGSKSWHAFLFVLFGLSIAGSFYWSSSRVEPSTSLIVRDKVNDGEWYSHNATLRKRDDYSCGPGDPCSNGACCGASGFCGYGATYCGAGCSSNCDAVAECGVDASPSGKTCPLNTCCSQYGFVSRPLLLPYLLIRASAERPKTFAQASLWLIDEVPKANSPKINARVTAYSIPVYLLEVADNQSPKRWLATTNHGRIHFHVTKSCQLTFPWTPSRMSIMLLPI